jgi:hypothetical protein
VGRLTDVFPREIEFTRDGVTLSGSIWVRHLAPPLATVVMHPGSGPADRDNDGYFVPLRNALVGAGYAVASFDKRGVGRSTGDWHEAPIETQATDLIAAVDVLSGEDELAGVPIGLFGHSQGGWVVLETAGRRGDTSFVIVNSGPGVTPAAQERHAALIALQRAGASPAEVETGLARYDEMVGLARAGATFEEMSEREDLALFAPDDPGRWNLWMSILDYDPKPALRKIKAPILTLWGGSDAIVPVDDSLVVFRAAIPPTRLAVEVLAGADHRIQVGEPASLAPGYVEKVLAFLSNTI